MKNFLLTALFTVASLGAYAQSALDVGLFRNGSDLEVRVRPTSDFDGVFSAMVFTVRWDRSTGATLGAPVQRNAAETYMPVAPSGGVHEVGAKNYQIFAGFGFQRLTTTGETWEAGKEYVIATIPVQGTADFELINDSWTGEVTSNGDYYVSLNGVDQTGIIYKDLVNASSDTHISVVPNPNNGQFTFSFNVEEAANVRIELVNALGQTVFTEDLRQYTGTYRQQMDLTTMSNGFYYLKVMRGDRTDVEKVVYR